MIAYQLYKGVKDHQAKKANKEHLTAMPEADRQQALQYTDASKHPFGANPGAKEQLPKDYQQRLDVTRNQTANETE
ncbi:hypothetical protein P7C71_g382, partial [Lecanoromycetidae sp. Uapishka_2]